MNEQVNKQWRPVDIALLKFAKDKRLTDAQIASLLGRTAAGVSMKLMSIKDFESGSLKTKYSSDLIQRGLQLEFRVRTDARYLEIRQQWEKKITAVNGITYSVDPEVVELHKRAMEEEKDSFPKEIPDLSLEEKTAPPPVEKKMPIAPTSQPFFSINIDIEGIVTIIKALKGN